ncbi:hypothetical protein LR48_Vigan03g213800 [Vigna angularis]|uniref:Uncharacterized protein n=1 Tax=Phaseolus angularis TaxID=3914 RepID=A0A0L9U7Q0_PHAAN|nr:hypothetical protein LR48_Vigan03g213800 [Vigna angularis]
MVAGVESGGEARSKAFYGRFIDLRIAVVSVEARWWLGHTANATATRTQRRRGRAICGGGRKQICTHGGAEGRSVAVDGGFAEGGHNEGHLQSFFVFASKFLHPSSYL